MKRKFVFSVMLICLLTFGGVLGFAQDNSKTTVAWEYNIVKFDLGDTAKGKLTTTLNELGKEGWELVSFYADLVGPKSIPCIILKREKK